MAIRNCCRCWTPLLIVAAVVGCTTYAAAKIVQQSGWSPLANTQADEVASVGHSLNSGERLLLVQEAKASIMTRVRATLAAPPSWVDRKYVVRQDASGNVRGRFSVIDSVTRLPVDASDMEVKFIRAGQVASSTALGVGGEFSVSGLSTGTYSIVGGGSGGFFVTGLYVAPLSPASADGDRRLSVSARRDTTDIPTDESDVTTIETLAVPAESFDIAKDLLAQYFSAYAGEQATGDPAVPGSLYDQLGDLPVHRISTKDDVEIADEANLAAEDADVNANTERTAKAKIAGTSLRGYAVHLSQAGDFWGTIDYLDEAGNPHPVYPGTVVLARGGRMIGETQTDVNGHFSYATLPAGDYSIFSLSRRGFLAQGVVIVAPAPVGDSPSDEDGTEDGAPIRAISARKASLLASAADQFSAAVAPVSDVTPAVLPPTISPTSSPLAGAPYGAAGGGGFGSPVGGGAGGGAGGIGDLGSALGAAGLGAGLANSGNNGTGPASSPN